MRIAIVGVGGVGGYFGGRLAAAGEEVIFLARGEHLRALQNNGLRVESILGDFVVQPVQATDDPTSVGIVDAVIVAVKASQISEAAAAMIPLLGPTTCVIPLQNGVEAPAQLAELLGAPHVVGGLCGLVSFISAPGCIRHESAVPFVKFGELNNRPSPRLEQLRQAFMRAGVKVEIPADIHAALWMKFLFSTPCSGIGGLTRSPIGVWRSVPETRKMTEQVVQEVIAVAQARGITLPANALQITMRLIDSVSPEATVSMQRDIMEGSQSELEAQIGAVIRLGQAVGVATPVHSFIYGSLLPMEKRAQGKLQFTV